MKKRDLIGLIISLIVIAYVLIKLDWKAVRETFSNLDWHWLAAAFGVYLINYGLRTLRFRFLLNLSLVPFRSLFGITNMYGMYLYLLPAKSGEVSYPLLLKNYLRIPLTESTATLVTARFLDFATIALFLPFVLGTFWHQIHPWVRAGSLLFVGGVLFFGLSLLWFVRNPIRIQNIQRIKISSRFWITRVWNALLKLFASLQVIDQRQQYLRLWLLTIAIWLCVQTNFYFIMLSLGASLTFMQMIVVSIIMVPMTLLPIQGFANLGTHEIGWSAAFALFGYSKDTALTLAISTHIILLFFVLFLGLIGYLLLSAK